MNNIKAQEAAMHELFDKYVPACGTAANMAGELVRAFNRIEYRNWNDGDYIGIGYGRETCNPAARFLQEYGDANITAIIGSMWGDYYRYEEKIDELRAAILGYIESNPELLERDAVDMWSCRDAEEDTDNEDYWDEEDEEEDY